MPKLSEIELWLEFHQPVRAISDFLKWHRQNVAQGLESMQIAKTYGGLDAPERIPAGSTMRPFSALTPASITASRITIR